MPSTAAFSCCSTRSSEAAMRSSLPAMPDCLPSSRSPSGGGVRLSSAPRFDPSEPVSAGARLKRGLPAQQFVEPTFELFLVEQLAAGGAVDLLAQLGDAILVGILLRALARDETFE